MYLIVGLGNPGKQYESTRHNIGFRVVDSIAKDLNIRVSKGQCRAIIGQGLIGDKKILLAKPQTFMNLSGESILELFKWYKIEKDHLVIIHDDLDLDLGKVRIRPHGNSGGHKGIESVIEKHGTTEFIRIKIGIGRASLGGDNSEYVLANVPKEQMEPIDEAIVLASEAAKDIVTEGINAAMNKYNQS